MVIFVRILLDATVAVTSKSVIKDKMITGTINVTVTVINGHRNGNGNAYGNVTLTAL